MVTRTLLATAGFFAGVVCVGTAGDDGPKVDKEVREELKRLEGEWRVVSAEMDGDPIGSKSLVRFAGDKCTISEPGSGLPACETTLTLDPTKKPKWMDVTNPKKITHRGIYELKGDSLKAVFQPDQKKGRPTEFRTAKGSGLVMYTYERVKPE